MTKPNSVPAHGDQPLTLTPELVRALAKFFIDGAQRSFEGFDWEGSDIQELALKLGLFDQVPYDPEVHDFDVDEVDPGDPIYVIKPAILVVAK